MNTEWGSEVVIYVIFYTIFKINIPREWVSNITLVSLKHSICSTCSDQWGNIFTYQIFWIQLWKNISLENEQHFIRPGIKVNAEWTTEGLFYFFLFVRFYDCFYNYTPPCLTICYSRLFMHPRSVHPEIIKLSRNYTIKRGLVCHVCL